MWFVMTKSSVEETKLVLIFCGLSVFYFYFLKEDDSTTLMTADV